MNEISPLDYQHIVYLHLLCQDFFNFVVKYQSTVCLTPVLEAHYQLLGFGWVLFLDHCKQYYSEYRQIETPFRWSYTSPGQLPSHEVAGSYHCQVLIISRAVYMILHSNVYNRNIFLYQHPVYCFMIRTLLSEVKGYLFVPLDCILIYRRIDISRYCYFYG